MPEVSVAMSVYNGEKYLRDSIESILKQTYKNFEFIICDDASTDSSVEIIQEYMKVDKRIVLLKNDTNLGLASSLNKCISQANGNYIARMDADDLSLPDRFEKQIAFLKQNEQVSFVCGGVFLIDDDGILGERVGKKSLTKENVFKYQPIAHPTVIIKKKVLEEVSGYTVAPYTKRGQDFDLWCKLYSKGYYGENLKQTVLYYREDKLAYQKRLFKYRLDSFKLKRIWRKKLDLPYFYDLYAYKQILAGLIPVKVMERYHKIKFKNA